MSSDSDYDSSLEEEGIDTPSLLLTEYTSRIGCRRTKKHKKPIYVVLAGQDGKDGKDGKDGQDGTDGQVGPPGEIGPQGVPGPLGQKGPTGDPGPTGPTGPTGPDGMAGISGMNGPVGLIGLPGFSPTGPPASSNTMSGVLTPGNATTQIPAEATGLTLTAIGGGGGGGAGGINFLTSLLTSGAGGGSGHIRQIQVDLTVFPAGVKTLEIDIPDNPGTGGPGGPGFVPDPNGRPIGAKLSGILILRVPGGEGGESGLFIQPDGGTGGNGGDGGSVTDGTPGNGGIGELISGSDGQIQGAPVGGNGGNGFIGGGLSPDTFAGAGGKGGDAPTSGTFPVAGESGENGAIFYTYYL